MSLYLHDIPLEDARSHFKQALAEVGLGNPFSSEVIPLDEYALGRVLAEPVVAAISAPHYHAAAMDGFAVLAETTSGALPARPISLSLPAEAVYVDTGDALPDWANAIVPIEEVEPLNIDGTNSSNPRNPQVIRLRAALVPWSHVRPMGEDIVASQLVLLSGRHLQPADLGAAAACGTTTLKVTRKPRVAILPTGSELIPVGEPVRAGAIIEFNSIVMAAQVRQWGGEPFRMPITPDDPVNLRQAVQDAADKYDLVLVNAGSSAGSEDFTAQIVSDLGTLLVHGIAVRPGHPVILGLIKRRIVHPGETEYVPVIGVPGYPVSAAMTMDLFVKPLIESWLGTNSQDDTIVQAVLTRKIVSPPGDDDYVRVAVGRVDKRLLAAPLPRGAGVITSLTRSDGVLVIPRGVQGLEAGASVSIRMTTPLAELERTIFAIGSHDMTLDLFAQALLPFQRRLVSANVGSQSGLVALRRGETHLAGTHLLDPETGVYNISYLARYLAGVPIRLVRWAEREQGLMVLPGNPKDIHDFSALARKDIQFVNRQRGAGTRVLLDYLLAKQGISPQDINGYDQEEYTHLAVAVAVASGRADCGLGVAAAARALGLDFVPIASESYELAMPITFADSELAAPLFRLMADNSFKESIAQVPGYNTSKMGSISFEGTP